MPTYVLMTKLAPEEMRGRKAAGREWKALVDKACPEVRWIAHYAVLGQYDFMDIYEAPGDESAIKVSLLSRERGAVVAESWPAVTYEHFLELADGVEKVVRKGKRKR